MVIQNEIFREQMHSYALARLMMHAIGYENFKPADHAIHGLLIDDISQNYWQGNFQDKLRERIESREKLMNTQRTKP